MKITEHMRRYSAEKELDEETAIKRALEDKAKEFATAGDVYQKV
jgi:hypothetical protein